MAGKTMKFNFKVMSTHTQEDPKDPAQDKIQAHLRLLSGKDGEAPLTMTLPPVLKSEALSGGQTGVITVEVD